MKAKLYWTIQHLKGSIHDLRFAATCWWLSQQVDFLEWRWQFNALMPQAQPIPAPIQSRQGGTYAVHAL